MTPSVDDVCFLAPNASRLTRCDAWSFAMTAYETLTGSVPWRGLTPTQIVELVGVKDERPRGLGDPERITEWLWDDSEKLGRKTRSADASDRERKIFAVTFHEHLVEKCVVKCWARDPHDRPHFARRSRVCGDCGAVWRTGTREGVEGCFFRVGAKARQKGANATTTRRTAPPFREARRPSRPPAWSSRPRPSSFWFVFERTKIVIQFFPPSSTASLGAVVFPTAFEARGHVLLHQPHVPLADDLVHALAHRAVIELRRVRILDASRMRSAARSGFPSSTPRAKTVPQRHVFHVPPQNVVVRAVARTVPSRGLRREPAVVADALDVALHDAYGDVGEQTFRCCAPLSSAESPPSAFAS